jgi:hypothetical protein
MNIADTAPDAAVQMLICSSVDSHSWRQAGPVTRPLLDASQMDTLLADGVDAAIVVSCGNDLDALMDITLDAVARVCAASYSFDSVAVLDAFVQHPLCDNASMWKIIDAISAHDSARVPETYIERAVADLDAGDREIIDRCRDDHRRVPWKITSRITDTASGPILAELLAGPGAFRFTTGLALRRDDLLATDPLIAAAFIRHASVDELCAGHLGRLVHDTDCAAALAKRAVTDTTGKVVAAVARVEPDQVPQIVQTVGGAKIAQQVVTVGTGLGSGTIPQHWTACVNAAVPHVDTDVLEAFPGTLVVVGELLRRRGVADATSWRCLLADGDHTDPAGPLADTYEAMSSLQPA